MNVGHRLRLQEPETLHRDLSSIALPADSDGEDDMDCSPISPIALSDVEMEILTDTPPTPDHIPWSQWNVISPPHYNVFAAPLPISPWQAPTQDMPLSPYQSCLAESGTLYPSPPTAHARWGIEIDHNFVSHEASASFGLSPPTYGPYTLAPPDESSDLVQNTPDDWEGQPYGTDTLGQASIAAFADEFARLLTSRTVERSDPADVIEYPLRINDPGPLVILDRVHSTDDPGYSLPGEGIATPLKVDQDQSLLSLFNFPESPPARFERESTAPPEKAEEREATEELDESEEQQATLPPLGTPSSRRASKSLPNSHFAPTDHTEPPPAQASVQASGCAQQQPHKGARRSLRRPSRRAHIHDDKGDTRPTPTLGASSMPWTALGLVPRPPSTPRCRRWRRGDAENTGRVEKEGEEEEERLRRLERRARTKRTRFVAPGEELAVSHESSPVQGARQRWGGLDESEGASAAGPLRSVLRNRHTTPYDKRAQRVRRASVP